MTIIRKRFFFVYVTNNTYVRGKFIDISSNNVKIAIDTYNNSIYIKNNTIANKTSVDFDNYYIV